MVKQKILTPSKSHEENFLRKMRNENRSGRRRVGREETNIHGEQMEYKKASESLWYIKVVASH